MRTPEEEASYQLFGDSAYYARNRNRVLSTEQLIGPDWDRVTFQQLVERIKKARSK